MWEKINEDLKQAMRDKNEAGLSALRLLVSAIKYKKIALNKGTQPEPLTDAEIIEVIQSEIKKRKDSIESYEQGNRPELAAKEKAEADLLAAYLPAQLSDADIEAIVREVITTLGEVTAKDTGRIIGQVMPRVKGQADGGRVSAIVKKILG
jgi:hypothetical protein